MVVFGRPKGDRGSYRQWEEEGIPPQVVIEVLSPGNTYDEMIDKLLFYKDHGVLEYYIYNPDRNRLEVYRRQEQMLRPMERVRDWTSPLLGIRFALTPLTDGDMMVYGPEGRRFMTCEELMALYETAQSARDAMQKRAEQAKSLAREAAQRAESAAQRAESAERRAERLAENLRQLGIDPNGS